MYNILDDLNDSIFGNKRMDGLKHFSRTKDFGFKRRVKAEWLPIDVQAMEVFHGNARKTIKGFLYKKDVELDTLAQIMDYRYHSDWGTRTTTVFLFETKAFDLPYFMIEPKGSFRRLGNIFRNSEWKDVNAAFADHFEITSSDMNAMRILVTIQFAEIMLRLRGFTVEGRGDYLAIYKKGSSIDIVDMDNVHLCGLDLIDIMLNDHSNEYL